MSSLQNYKFEDHFTSQAREYARYRPHYPPELYAYLASISPANELAWDCATGNGQAATALARHFERVVATDASREQLEQAFPHPRVTYRREPAEHVSLDPGTVDLVTVALAIHWFELDEFYREVRRALKTGGIMAAWGYHMLRIDPQVDQVVWKFYAEVLAGYWPEKLQLLADHYRTLPFPFAEIQPPKFVMQAAWDLDQLAGFMHSWSGTQRYLQKEGRHPLGEIWEELSAAWGDPDAPRPVRWELFLRVGNKK
jgi:SAM-dependent methyltransferase